MMVFGCGLTLKRGGHVALSSPLKISIDYENKLTLSHFLQPLFLRAHRILCSTNEVFCMEPEVILNEAGNEVIAVIIAFTSVEG